MNLKKSLEIEKQHQKMGKKSLENWIGVKKYDI